MNLDDLARSIQELEDIEGYCQVIRAEHEIHAK